MTLAADSDSPMGTPVEQAAELAAEPAILIAGRYQLRGRIAAGSVGSVFLASELASGGEVVVKLFDVQADGFDAWYAELRAVQRLKHPHIAPCLDVGRDPDLGVWFLTFPRARGGSLRRAMHEKRFLPEEIGPLVSDLAEGLAHAHRHGIVHRDVKPENVLAAERIGEGPWWLTDFGAGRFLSRGKVAPSVAGSLDYMAPEIFDRDGLPASDQYSLGVLALELLSGTRPTRAQRSAYVVAARGQSGLPGVIARLLRSVPDQRFPCLELLPLALRAKRFDLAGGDPSGGDLLTEDGVYRVTPSGEMARPLRIPNARWFLSAAGAAASGAGAARRRVVACDRRLVELTASGSETLYADGLPFDGLALEGNRQRCWIRRAGKLELAEFGGRRCSSALPLPEPFCGDFDQRRPRAADLADGASWIGLTGEASALLAAADGGRPVFRLQPLPLPLWDLLEVAGRTLALLGDQSQAKLCALQPQGVTVVAEGAFPVEVARVLCTDGQLSLSSVPIGLAAQSGSPSSSAAGNPRRREEVVA